MKVANAKFVIIKTHFVSFLVRAFINPEEWLHHGCANGYSTTKNGVVTTPLNKSKKAPVGTPASEPAEIYCCPICQVLMEAAVDLQKHLFDHVKNQCRYTGDTDIFYLVGIFRAY